MKKNYKFFWYEEGFLNTNTQNIIWCYTNILERTMYLAIISLLMKSRFQTHWSDGKHMLKYGQ